MAGGTWIINRDYDQRAALDKVAQDLLKLDAEGCRIVQAVAVAWLNWEPLEPTYDGDISRAGCGEQFQAVRDLIEAMLGDAMLAERIAPLAEACQKHQTEIEGEEAEFERRAKRRRRRQPQHQAEVLSFVPKKDDDPSGTEGN